MTSLFEHNNVQSFLRDFFADLPKRGWGTSRKLALHLKVNTSLISLVLTGRQSLSIEQAHGVTKFFGWGKLESKYFLLMVQYERAGTEDLRQFFLDEMTQLKKESLKISKRLEKFTGLSDEQRTKFYSSSMYSKIRLFCSLDKTGKSVDQIQERFNLPLADLRPMIDFLTRTELLRVDTDKYQMGHQHTHLDKDSPHLVRHHTNWRIESIRRAENLSDVELMFTGPMSMSEADFMKIREDVLQLIKRSVETMKASPEEVLVCLNVDWIKI